MIGVDLVYLPEFKLQLKLGGQTFLNKAFNEEEQKNQKLEHLAGIWAAKEAVFKASPNSIVRPWNEIEIRQSPDNKLSSTLDGIKYEISISHKQDYVIAVAVEGKNEI